MRRFYADQAAIGSDTIELGRDETHHMRDVLRTRVGEIVHVFDGEGREYKAFVEEIGRDRARLTNQGETAPASPESPLAITLAAAMLKPDRFDMVVQKAVELGVTRLVPLITERSAVRADVGEKKIERWRRIVMDASKQCGRARLMQVTEPADISTLISLREQSHPVIFAESGDGQFEDVKQAEAYTLLIGPEGGWEPTEIEMVLTRGGQAVTLGGRILRAETAAIAVTALIQHRFGDLN